MRSRRWQIPLTALGLLALFAAGCNSPEEAVQGAPPPPRWLTVVTPHNERIQRAFSGAFNEWYERAHKTSVFFDWVERGTPECIAFVERTARQSEGSERSRPDVLFGGGIADHGQLAEQGLSRPLKLADALEGIPEQVDGLPTRDPQGRWFAVGLSSFGIVYNKHRLAQWGLPEPRTWTDLGDPRLASWMAIADPAASGSNLACMTIVIQKLGWEEGWATLMRMLANSRALVDRSSVALNQVNNGVSLAALAVNFDGLDLAARSEGNLAYVNPAGATAVTPSIVSALAMSDDPALAEQFVRFCLSGEGQQLWGLRSEHHPEPWPTLYHYPIRPEIYEQFGGQLAVPDNPFKVRFGVGYDLEAAARQDAILVPLVHAACGENHVLLQQAWAAVAAAGMKPDALAELTKPPFDEATAYEMGQGYRQASEGEQKRFLAEWSKVFADKYRRVLELARG
jgi:ABC-type Fe3+ transport system substrate-binding protein